MKYSGPLGVSRLTGVGPMVSQEQNRYDASFARSLLRQYGTDLGVESDTIERGLDILKAVPGNFSIERRPEPEIAASALLGGSQFSGEDISAEEIEDVSGIDSDTIERGWVAIKGNALGIDVSKIEFKP